jgi:hypothetical protein
MFDVNLKQCICLVFNFIVQLTSYEGVRIGKSPLASLK